MSNIVAWLVRWTHDVLRWSSARAATFLRRLFVGWPDEDGLGENAE